MITKNNVVIMNQGSVYEDIRTFLIKHEQHSKNTRDAYERSIRKFFMFMRNKSIEELNNEDLKFRNADMVRYQAWLKEQYSSPSTVNSYVAAIVSLYDFFERNEYKVKSSIMKVELLADESESYGKLYLHEAEEFAQRAKRQVKGQEKSALIRLAYTTSFRKQEILNINWDDISHNPEKDVYLVTVIGKGKKKNVKPISKDLYDELLKIQKQKYYNRYDDNKIFHLSETTIQSMMDTLKEEMNIPESRNIVFHSLRNVLANYIKETEKDPFKIKKQLNHANLNTSMKYLEEDEDYTNMAGIQIENKIDDNIFDELSREEMLELLKGQSNGILMTLKIGAKKIVEGRV